MDQVWSERSSWQTWCLTGWKRFSPTKSKRHKVLEILKENSQVELEAKKGFKLGYVFKICDISFDVSQFPYHILCLLFSDYSKNGGHLLGDGSGLVQETWQWHTRISGGSRKGILILASGLELLLSVLKDAHKYWH